MFSFAISLLGALVAIPKIGELVKDFVAGAVSWYIQSAEDKTLGEVADAMSIWRSSKTEKERYAATDALARALKRPRVTK